jgi:hypothetical protein
LATDVSPGEGKFEWKLGDEVLINDNEPQEVEDNNYEQVKK